MINLNNLNRQHERIIEEVEYLDKEIKKGSLSMNSSEIAIHINYNVSSKIINNTDMFLKEIQRIIKALKDRITKEDNELYYLIQLKKI